VERGNMRKNRTSEHGTSCTSYQNVYEITDRDACFGFDSRSTALEESTASDGKREKTGMRVNERGSEREPEEIMWTHEDNQECKRVER
jgi:hypothetical protein